MWTTTINDGYMHDQVTCLCCSTLPSVLYSWNKART